MKNISKNLINNIKENKYIYLILMIFLAFFTYCSFNTFIINDDLPYSFFYRGPHRITNIKEVLLNQYNDYFNINSRVIVHSVVQSLLIFGKNVWSILNPIFIIGSFICMNKIISLITNDDKNKILNYALIGSLFLMLIYYKKIIYWVAGSVNYVWTGFYLLLLIYLYLKNGYSKKNLINIIIIFSIGILHEYLLVFSIVFVLLTYIKEVKISKKYLNEKVLYFFPLIISYLFLMKSPAVIMRLNDNPAWNELNLIEKIVKSFPFVSKKFLDILNVNNLVPTIFVLLLIIALLKLKDKKSIILSIITIINVFLILIIQNNWLYLLLSIIILLDLLYYNNYKDRNDLSIVIISMYSIVYSMGITAEYMTNRSSYVVYLILICLVVIIIHDLINEKTLKKLIVPSIILVVLFIINDIKIYSLIGSISRQRIQNIDICRENNCEVLKLKRIPDKYEYYHMDINSPGDNRYFAFESFTNYYNLDKNIKIELYK